MSIPASLAVAGPASDRFSARAVYPFQSRLPLLVAAGAAIGYLLLASPLGAAIGGVLPLVAGLTWRRGQVPVFPLAFSLQWFQVSSGHLYQAVTGRWLLATSAPAVEQATYLGLGALAALAVGARLGMGSARGATVGEGTDEPVKPPTVRLVAAVAAAVVASPILSAVAWRLPAITQPINALLMIKWVLFYLLFYRAIVSREKRVWAVALLLVEGFLGFTSFFSLWKTPLMVLMLAVLTVPGRPKARRILAGISLAVVGFGLAVLWLDIREAIRADLTGGRGKSRSDILVGALESSGLLIAGRESPMARVDFLIERTSYVYYFAHVVERIPSRRPYEDGGLYLAALRHVLMPRLLFPSKPRLRNDSWYVAEFAGIRLPVVEGGTSVSIGYAAESYADLGPVWMFVPLLLFGVLLGLMARALMRLPLGAVTVSGFLVAALFFQLHLFEMTLVKLIGGQLTAFIFLYLFGRFFGRSFERWLGGEPQTAVRALRLGDER